MKFKIPIYWVAKVPCWNYCDLSVSLTTPVANLLHCSKLLPGCIVYSGLNINLPSLCSSHKDLVRSCTATRPTFSLGNSETASLTVVTVGKGRRDAPLNQDRVHLPTHPKCPTVLCRVPATQTGSSNWLREDILLIVNGWLVNPCDVTGFGMA